MWETLFVWWVTREMDSLWNRWKNRRKKMAERHVVVCDNCGKERSAYGKSEANWIRNAYANDTLQLDLCEKCVRRALLLLSYDKEER